LNWINGAVSHEGGFKKAVRWFKGETARATYLIQPHIVPVVHPSLTLHFLDSLKSNHKMSAQIGLIYGDWDEMNKPERVITNQMELVKKHNQTSRQNVTLFRPGQYGTRVVIGSHGGRMENAFRASRSCKIVEILPLEESGAYPNQGKPEFPPMFEGEREELKSVTPFVRIGEELCPKVV
jgi:hypothetical protein